eukprot:SAG25_NODE_3089_length_1223_cov_22.924357_2_plen_150_part_00
MNQPGCSPSGVKLSVPTMPFSVPYSNCRAELPADASCDASSRVRRCSSSSMLADSPSFAARSFACSSDTCSRSLPSSFCCSEATNSWSKAPLASKLVTAVAGPPTVACCTHCEPRTTRICRSWHASADSKAPPPGFCSSRSLILSFDWK